MAITTTNLGLRTPELTDDPRQVFITDMQHNNNTLDDMIIIDYATIPHGQYPRDKKVFYKNRNIGDYVGSINIRTGEYTSAWSALKLYTIGDKVSPTVNNGHYYTCKKTGYSSPFEPDWMVSNSSMTEDTKNKAVWQAAKFYEVNDIVVPTIGNDMFYHCVTAGTSGVLEPTWTSEGSSVVDHQAIWLGYRIVKWQESGTSAHFRPFGKID